MAKRARKKAVTRAKRADRAIPVSRTEPVADDADGELATAICGWFCDGVKPADLPAYVQERFGFTISRERPYAILRQAAKLGRFTFDAPLEYRLGRDLTDQHVWLEVAEIVKTKRFRDVGARAARTLLEMVRKKTYELGTAGQPKVVHIGFAGGHTTRVVAEEFGRLLRSPSNDLPDHVVIHSLTTGAQSDDPTTDPNTFFNYFRRDGGLTVDVTFNALHGPLMPDRRMLERLLETPEVIEAREAGQKMNIVVTAAGSWARNESQLKKNIERYADTVMELESYGCIADICWQPISAKGPIEREIEYRAMTLLSLSEMQKRIAQQRIKVLLVLGPTGSGEPRDDVLRSLLAIEPPLFTHLVADLETARPAVPKYEQLRQSHSW